MKQIKKQHRLWWQSSYDRGLDILLYMWPDILKRYPDAELWIAYGWNLFDVAARSNPERRHWKEGVEIMMQQKGITHFGRLGQDKLKGLRKQCGILAYPTYFTEIFMIGAMESQRDGLVPVTTSLAALEETVGSGVKIDGDIKEPKTQKAFLEALLEMMGDEEKWKKESIKAKKFASNYDWSKIARDWTKVLDEPVTNPKVSIITPTIRTGWWNIMAQNISIQTYKNIEWIIVDDYKEDRSETAKKYAEKYNLPIRYLRGSTGSNYPRKCGLVRANNIGWKNAEGELLVWLQDFILMPKDGIERLVDVYRHHPNDLIAPVDKYYHALPADRENKEDWWNGQTQIITSEGWTNPRVRFEGMRESENPYEYEANYGAIPKKILDKLNGWWEFMDDGLGYDNYEIAYRALLTGSKIIVDDTNICKCINIWPEVKGTAENVLNRERMANPPRAGWLVRETEAGNLPIIREQKIDDKIHLDFDLPDIKDEDFGKWVKKNSKSIVKQWGDVKSFK